LLKRLFDNALNGLSAVAIAGLIGAFLSYCASYGQFAVLDRDLLPAFSSADLATNFSIVAIPLFQAVVAAVTSSLFFHEFLAGERKLRGQTKKVTALNSCLIVLGLFGAFAYIVGSTDVYELGFRTGVIFLTVTVALSSRLNDKLSVVHHLWKSSPLNMLIITGFLLVFFAWLLSSYGEHISIDRMKHLRESKLYLQSPSARPRKVVVVFASQERAVLFDGTNIFLLAAEKYGDLISRPNAFDLTERTYWQRISGMPSLATSNGARPNVPR
jgi:hypothetical protein